MHKRNKFSWRLVTKQLSSVFLIAIIFLSPTFVSAFTFQDFNYTRAQATTGTTLITLNLTANSTDFIGIEFDNAATATLNFCNVNGVAATLRDSITVSFVSHLLDFVSTTTGNQVVVCSLSTPGVAIYQFSTFSYSLDSSTTTISTSTIITTDNPNQNLFNGFLIFFALMSFAVYLFKK